tara:strand:+ start:6687 stop:7112 length:426 start_codon:yes stop_codon:yes gene_type:complete
MSFNYMNASNITFNDVSATLGAADERINIGRVTAPVDVSAIESVVGVTGGLSANGSNYLSLGPEDGGSTGTGTTDIGTAVASSSTDFTDVTPRAVTASTSASDLDADDYVNFHIDETGNVSAVTGIHIMMNYVTGVPGGIV